MSKKFPVKLVFNGWEIWGPSGPRSASDSDIVSSLTMPNLRSGAEFRVTVELGDDEVHDILSAMLKHNAYPIFQLRLPGDDICR